MKISDSGIVFALKKHRYHCPVHAEGLEIGEQVFKNPKYVISTFIVLPANEQGTSCCTHIIVTVRQKRGHCFTLYPK